MIATKIQVTTSTVKLEMTGEEALWLKAVMQNPLHGNTPQDEPRHDHDNRHALWQALDKAGVSHA